MRCSASEGVHSCSVVSNTIVGSAGMRLRYLAVDIFDVASKSSRQEYLKNALPVPLVTCLEERFDTFSKLDGNDSCHRDLHNNSSPKTSFKLPQDFPRVGETTVYDKFLSEIFPVQVKQPSIQLGAGVLYVSEILCLLRSEIDHELQSLEEDALTCSTLQRIDSSQIHGVSKFYEEMKSASCSGQSTMDPQGKDPKLELTILELPEIETPLLELRDGFPWPQYDCSIIILELGGILRDAVEIKKEAAAKIYVPKAWFDVSALPYSPERYVNCSTALEGVFNDKQASRRIVETFISQWCLDSIINQTMEILPVETLMIPEKYNLQPVDQKEVIYPLKPSCLQQWFESHESTIEKEAQTLFIGDFNIQTNLEDILTSKLFYHDEYLQPAMLPPGLLHQSGPQLCCISVIDRARVPIQFSTRSYEVPRTCDWRLSSLASTSSGIIAAGEFQKVLPHLPVLCASKGFESLVVIPELSLDDDQFQFLPVPKVSCPLDDVIELGKLVSLNSDSSTLPATDWLYLDWHFYHGSKCTNATCFSLQSQLTEDTRCQSLPSTLVTTEVSALQKCSELPLELKLIQNYDFSVQDSYPGSHTAVTVGDKIEVHLFLPLADFQKRVELCRPATEGTQIYQDREHHSLAQKPSVGSTDVNEIAENVFLPHHASKGLHNLGTPGKSGFQLTNYGGNPVSKQRLPSQNQQAMEQLRITEPNFNEISCGGGDLHCKSQEERPSNHSVTRKDLRTISTRSNFDFMNSDLDFFVQARKGIYVTSTDRQTMKGSKENSSNGVNETLNSAYSQRALLTTGESDDQNYTTAAATVCEHEIEISKGIRERMFSLSENYFTLLAMEEILELTMQENLMVLQQFDFDVDGDNHLASLISNLASQPPSHQRQVLVRSLVALQVLRSTALNLCNYGIQVAHLFLETCFERMQFLEGYVMSSRTELEEAYNQVESGLLEDHPKVCYLDKIFRPVATETNEVKDLGRRILLLADRSAFFTLVRKLVSLGLTPYQIDRKENYLDNGVLKEESVDKLKDEILEALTFSDCLLVSYAYVHSCFPAQRFTMIIQYADPPNVGTTESSLRAARCEIHVLRLVVHIEDFQGNFSNSFTRKKKFNCQEPQTCNLSGSAPVLEPNPALSLSPKVASGESKLLNQDGPQIESGHPVTSSSECPNEQKVKNCSVDTRCEMIVVANISNKNDQVLTGRRSSFQKILHLEKENLQVVERELRLPVDLILSPASCLVVYTLGKLNLELQSLKEKQQAFLNEVITHLKAISFSFRDCIMIFEGPTEFTTAALDIFPHIYEVAIALEMEFLCFASRHAEVTDSVMIGSIQSVRTSKRSHSYPTMTESSTLAEVFLTQFPSINPLTAHAILSSGCALPEFMSYTAEQQLAAVEEYEVPKHCLDLFKAQCTFRAIATLPISDCEGVYSHASQQEEISYGHRRVPLADNEDLPDQGSPAEVWASLPEFPPASAISDPSFSANNTHTVSAFPDFPPISELRGCQDEAEEDPAALYRIPEKGRIQHPREICSRETLVRDGNSSGEDFGSTTYLAVGARHKFQIPLNTSAAYHKIQDLSFEPTTFQWSKDTSSPVNDSKCFCEAQKKFHGRSQISLDLAEKSGPEQPPRPQRRSGQKDDSRVKDVKRGASNSSFMCPPRHGKRLEMHHALGSWNDHKRVRIKGDFKDDTFNRQGYDRRFRSNISTESKCLDELSTAEDDWIDNTASVHEETTFYADSKQLRPPQATLKASSLDRFRHLNGSQALGTASTSYTRAQIKFPKTARRKRTQSPNVTYPRPAPTWEPT